MDRKDKINLLKGIQSGAISIETIQPRLFRLEIKTSGNNDGKGETKYFINNKKVTGDYYSKEVIKNNKGDHIDIMMDGMEWDEWRNFMKNKLTNKTP
ncbi:MAG TPA: hypothetical protein VIL78_07175 [Hanamia sp.]